MNKDHRRPFSINLAWRHIVLGTGGIVVLGAVSIAGQATPPSPAATPSLDAAPQGGVGPSQSAPMAETVFKNIQVLKGIPVDEFMDTMGMFAAATTKDCTGCHAPEILTGSRDAFSKPTPMIERAREMVLMMNGINKTYFRGLRRVTCYTCHSATPSPGRVPNLSIQYGTPPAENPNTMDFLAIPELTKQVDQIFAKYIQAVGGAQPWAKMTGFVATGTYEGWDTSHVDVPVEVIAKVPDQLTTIVHRHEGNNIWVFDGRNAWFAGIDAAAPNFTLTYTGGNLAGARVEALVTIDPTKIQQAFNRWVASEGLVDDKPVQILQGRNAGQPPVNLFFDESGLLIRMVRWNETAVGPVPTQYDYSDYREVGGTRRPFRWVRTWTNNKATFSFKDIRINVPIDAARFAKPAPVLVK